MKNVRSLGVVLLLGMATLCGCGAPQRPESVTGELKGKISIDGVPLTAGRLKAVCEDGQVSDVGNIDNSGGYVIPRVPLGKVVIQFIAPQAVRNKVDTNGPKTSKLVSAITEHPVASKKAIEYRKEMERVPVKYYEVDQSDLTTTVIPGINEFDLKMTSD